MAPYTAKELDAMRALSELRANSSAEARHDLVLLNMLSERDEVIATLHAKLDVLETRVREAVREYAATVRAT